MKKRFSLLAAFSAALPLAMVASAPTVAQVDYCEPGAYGVDTPGGIVARVVSIDDDTGLPSRLEYSLNGVLLQEGSYTPYQDELIVGEKKDWYADWKPMPFDPEHRAMIITPYLERMMQLPLDSLELGDAIPISGTFHVAEIPEDHIYPASETVCPEPDGTSGGGSSNNGVVRITAPVFDTTSDWQGGFTGTLTFEYIDPVTTTDWDLTFNAQFEITEMWDGLYTTTNNGDGTYTYVVSNETWNGALSDGDTVTITFNANDVSASVLPVEQLLSPILFCGGLSRVWISPKP